MPWFKAFLAVFYSVIFSHSISFQCFLHGLLVSQFFFLAFSVTFLEDISERKVNWGRGAHCYWSLGNLWKRRWEHSIFLCLGARWLAVSELLKVLAHYKGQAACIKVDYIWAPSNHLHDFLEKHCRTFVKSLQCRDRTMNLSLWWCSLKKATNQEHDWWTHCSTAMVVKKFWDMDFQFSLLNGIIDEILSAYRRDR